MLHCGVPLMAAFLVSGCDHCCEQVLIFAGVSRPCLSLATHTSLFPVVQASVLSASCDSKLDHVTGVGFGTRCGTDFWKAFFFRGAAAEACRVTSVSSAAKGGAGRMRHVNMASLVGHGTILDS